MSRSRLGVALVVTGLFACGWGCSGASTAEAERAVREYCEAVILAHRTHDVAPLRPVTTDRELRTVAALIDLKVAAGLVLESTLESLTVTGVERPSSGMMTVETTERWRYFDRPLEVGRSPGTEFVVEMDLEYTFVEGESGWLMDQARTLRSNYLEPEGYSIDDPHTAGHGDST